MFSHSMQRSNPPPPPQPPSATPPSGPVSSLSPKLPCSHHQHLKNTHTSGSPYLTAFPQSQDKVLFSQLPPTPPPPPKHHTRWPSKRLILKGAAPHGDNSHQSRGACVVGGALTRSRAAPTELRVVVFPLTCNTTSPSFPEPPKFTWQSLFGTLRRPLISFTSLNEDSAANFKPNC